MPVTNISLLRSYSSEEPPVNPPPLEPAYVPFYSVLFYYKNNSYWAADDNVANNGALGVDYYRRYYISDPKSLGTNFVYKDSNGVKTDIFSFPIIKCIDSNTDWKTRLGNLEASTTSMLPNAATLLENGGGHNPTSAQLKSTALDIASIKPGDTASTTKTYIDRTAPHGGHVHSIIGLRINLLGTNFGDFYKTYYAGTYLANSSTSSGFYSYEVETLIRDPKLAKKSAKLTYLPKNVLVFGDDLPSEYYTRTHPTTSTGVTPADTGLDALPILAKFNPNFVSGNELLTNLLGSNNSGEHTHAATTKFLSTATGLTSFNYTSAGQHNHLVTYTYDVTLKSKKLKTWFTLSANTPISNGVIIAFSNGTESGYDGNITDDSILPPYWHFCDGNNGTPDLRDYYVMFNFLSNDHDQIYYNTNEATIVNINVQASGNHTHFTPTTSIQDGTPYVVGGHGKYISLDHTHGVSAATSFKLDGALTPVTNIRPNMTFDYTPPTSSLAFIMYNENIP